MALNFGGLADGEFQERLRMCRIKRHFFFKFFFLSFFLFYFFLEGGGGGGGGGGGQAMKIFSYFG